MQSVPGHCMVNRKISKSQSMLGNSNSSKRQKSNTIFFDENNEVVRPAAEDQANPFLLDGYVNLHGEMNKDNREANEGEETEEEQVSENLESDSDSDSNFTSKNESDDTDDDDNALLIDNDYFEVGSAHFIDENLKEQNLMDLGDFDFKDEFFTPWYSEMISRSELTKFDRQTKIYKGSIFSKEDFAKDVKDFIERTIGSSSNQKKTSVEEDLMVNLMLKYSPENSDLPMDFSYRGGTEKPIYVSKIAEYVKYDPYEDRTIFIDICQNNCVAFVGNYRSLNRCPTCSGERYHKCTREKCRYKKYDDCDCDYNGYRRGKKRLAYRSIIQLFIRLLEFEFFVQLCNTIIAVPEENDADDIKHGFTYKKNLGEMKKNFQKWSEANPEDAKTRTSVNLLLSFFYDGIKVYNWKHSSFWPLIISILNLPPTYRSKFCVGQFIIGLLTVSQGGAGEHLLLQCLLDELLLLESGISINTSKGKKYFLQVRLIQYLLDTPAASKFFGYQSHGSLAGCVYCGRVCGKRIDILNKTVYIGHRFLLPLDHYLRIFGQTGTCCPKHFYPLRLIENNLERDDDEVVNYDELEYYDQNENNAVVQLKKRVLQKAGLCIDTNQHQVAVANFVQNISNPNRTFSWFNQFDKRLFDNYLYYLHCDLRPTPKTYNLQTRTNIYRQLCNIAENDNEHIQGVKQCPSFARLPYFNFHEQFCPVNCHVIANNVKEYFDNVKGTNDLKNVLVSQKTKSFPWLYRKTAKDDDGTLPWNLTKGNMNIIDAHINCIIVPLGYSQDFQITNPYQQTDVLNMRGKFHIGATLMELILHWSLAPFDIAYKAYYLLFSKGLQNLMLRRKQVDSEGINLLDREIKEIVSLHEGIFPIGSQDTINHQLVDLPLGIRLFGSLSSFNSFSLERAGGIFKRMLKKGGKATEIGLMKQYDHIENKTINLVYSQKINTLFSNTEKENSQLLKKLNPRSLLDNLDPHVIHFTEYRIALYDRSTISDRTISDQDIFQFIENSYVYILNKLRIQGYHGDELESKGTYESALFRIVYRFKGYKNKNERIGHPEITFQDYFSDIKKLTNNFTVQNAETMKILEKKYYIKKERITPNDDNFQYADWNDLMLVFEFVRYLRNITIYKSAYMYGLSFRSRKNTNSNALNLNWSSTDHIMSWAKYIDYLEFDEASVQGTVQGSRTLNSTDKYMNLNYFFRLDFPNEVHLHGMAVANGTSRYVYKTKVIPGEQWRKSSAGGSSSKETTLEPPAPHAEVNFLEHIVVGSEEHSLHKRSIFIPAVYIYATKVMIIPYHVRNFDYDSLYTTISSNSFRTLITNCLPFLLNKASEYGNKYAKCDKHEISFLTMIDMHPAKALDFRFNDLLLAHRNTISFINRYLFNSKLDSN